VQINFYSFTYTTVTVYLIFVEKKSLMLIKAVFIGPKLEEHRIYDYNLNSCFLLDFKYNLLM